MYPYSRHLTVATPKGTKVVKATLLGGKDTPVTETARNQHTTSMCPKKLPDGPFVIKLRIENSADNGDRYRDALT